MSNYSNAIGIDVSKATLDIFDYKLNIHIQVPNARAGHKKLLNWAYKNHSPALEGVILCFEHTGLYSLPLAMFLAEKGHPFSMVPGLEIKRSLGIVRGKSDKIDAFQIARYAYMRREQIKEYTLPSGNILKLKSLLTLREKLVRHRAGYQVSLKEAKTFFPRGLNTQLFVSLEHLYKQTSQEIKKIEAEMLQVIREDPELKKLFDLVTSVKGIGLVVGIMFIVYTNCFTAFENARQFAAYCGIAPFENQSGTSRHAPKRVSHLANKRVKALLSNSASISIQVNPEMKMYYMKRLDQGKNKLSTMNIIKNKIVARVFAVVKRETPYVDTLRYAA